MFGKNSINGSIEWIGVPNFLRNDGLPWILNLLAPYYAWGDRGSNTSLNLGSGSGGYSDGVSINCNRLAHILPIYYRGIFENTCSAARCDRDNILIENRTYRMQSPYTCRNPARGRLVNRQDDVLDDHWDFSVFQ